MSVVSLMYLLQSAGTYHIVPVRPREQILLEIVVECRGLLLVAEVAREGLFGHPAILELSEHQLTIARQEL